jgi:hypothetical protein
MNLNLGYDRHGVTGKSASEMRMESMASKTESEVYYQSEILRPGSSNWVKVGAVAAASAFIGGMAAAWWYRKTLKTLRQTGEMSSNPDFGISRDDSSYEL